MHFVIAGKNLVTEIERNNTNDGDCRQYLTTSSLTKYTFRRVTQAEIIKAVQYFKNKNSSGHDGIYQRRNCHLLDTDSSQMTTTSIFQKSFEKSNMVHFFKKGDPSLLVNC